MRKFDLRAAKLVNYIYFENKSDVFFIERFSFQFFMGILYEIDLLILQYSFLLKAAPCEDLIGKSWCVCFT